MAAMSAAGAPTRDGLLQLASLCHGGPERPLKRFCRGTPLEEDRAI